MEQNCCGSSLKQHLLIYPDLKIGVWNRRRFFCDDYTGNTSDLFVA